MIRVRWGYDDADGLLEELAGVRATRLCPRCGSTVHGRPVIPQGHASIARAGELSLVAVSEGPVGVDVEVSTATAPAGVTLHPSEAGLDPLRVWVRKEAVLKALGVGLQVEPSSFTIDHGVPSIAPELRVEDLEIPGHVAAIATAATADRPTRRSARPARPRSTSWRTR